MCVFDDVKNITNSKITRFNHDENGGLMKTFLQRQTGLMMMTMVVLVKSFYKDNHWLTRFNDYDNGGFNEKFLQR